MYHSACCPRRLVVEVQLAQLAGPEMLGLVVDSQLEVWWSLVLHSPGLGTDGQLAKLTGQVCFDCLRLPPARWMVEASFP